MKITDFELNAIKDAVKKQKSSKNLLLQMNNINIKKRTFTGMGFFSEISVIDSQGKLRSPIQQERFSCLFKSPILQFGGGAIVLVKDGYISQLEVYSYDEEFPNNIEKMQFIPV